MILELEKKTSQGSGDCLYDREESGQGISAGILK